MNDRISLSINSQLINHSTSEMAKDKKNPFRRQQNDQGPRGQTRGLQVHRSARLPGSISPPPSPSTTRRFSPRASASTAPASAAGARSTPATCSSFPIPTTAWIDVFNAEPTLSLICTIVDPITREPYDRDPRGVAEKAEAYLQSTGIADTAFFGPEAEFFIFDEVRLQLHREFLLPFRR